MKAKHVYIGIGALLLTGAIVVIIYKRKQIRKRLDNASDALEKWIKPVVGKITSKFGYRTDPKTGKAGEFHNGIDLALPVGTPIKSPMSGVVELVQSGGAGGNELILRHCNGYKTGYAHLSKILVKKGDKVKQGDLVAYSGNTGKSTGAHLHLTITEPSGRKVDPYKLLYI